MSRSRKSSGSFVSKSSNLFEALNLRYFGPIDGHDLRAVLTRKVARNNEP